MFVDVPTTDGAGVRVLVAAGSGTRTASAGGRRGAGPAAHCVSFYRRDPSLIARDVTENNGHNANYK